MIRIFAEKRGEKLTLSSMMVERFFLYKSAVRTFMVDFFLEVEMVVRAAARSLAVPRDLSLLASLNAEDDSAKLER